MQATVGRTIIIYKAQHAYSSHACIARLPDGDWLVAFAQSLERVPHMHPPSDPQFLNFITRSRDQGATWEAPRVAPGYDWHGVEVPGISALSSGEVLLNQWRFLWYPLEQAQALAARGEREIFVRTERRWQKAASEADWQRHPHPYARAEGGAWVHVSSDGGRTWEHTAEVAIAPYQGAFSPKGALELAGGDLLLALGSHDHCPLEASFCVRSRDRGRSWGAPVEVARKQGLIFSEPSAAQTASGTILVASREENHGHVHLSASRDGGATWELPARVAGVGLPQPLRGAGRRPRRHRLRAAPRAVRNPRHRQRRRRGVVERRDRDPRRPAQRKPRLPRGDRVPARQAVHRLLRRGPRWRDLHPGHLVRGISSVLRKEHWRTAPRRRAPRGIRRHLHPLAAVV